MTNDETPISDLGVQAKTGRRSTTKFEKQISYRTVPFIHALNNISVTDTVIYEVLNLTLRSRGAGIIRLDDIHTDS